MTLFWQQFRAQLRGLLIWSGASGLLAFMVTLSAKGASQGDTMTQIIAKLPAHLQALAGYSSKLSSLDSYMGTKLGTVVPLLVALYGALLALSAVTREVDRRTIDFLLSLPVRRTPVLAARMLVMATNTAVQAVVILLVTCFGLMVTGVEGNPGGYALMIANGWLMGLAVGAVSLLTSMWIDDYSFGVKLWMGLVVGFFMLEMMLKAAGLDRVERLFSPFRYADPILVLEQGATPAGDLLVLITLTVVAFGLSIPAFERKQITA